MSNDPWRYRCIECGSTQIVRRTSYGENKTVKGGFTAEKRWYCRGCNSGFDRRLDAKTQTEVA